MIRRIDGCIPLWQFELLSGFDSLGHGVTTRHGGVSEGPYGKLNLGLHVDDDPERVIENRRRVCQVLGVDFERCTFAQQVHGDSIRMVTAAEAGAGRARFEDGIPKTDGLVVGEPGVTVAVLVADCVPILLYDPENHVGAAVHAGWCGTARGIAARAVRLLAEECGSRPAALIVALGPAIGSCCYQVGAEVVAGLTRGFDYQEPVAERRGGNWHADLAKANLQQLTTVGVLAKNIEPSGVCTSCDSAEFYSDRKLGRPTGRFGAFISLRRS
ncbi:MAG: peptidoglycan editing factor PgeF [Armatimonadota bacterium]|nr:MAG: peptidoglycan editing factor PgeF [Armatimonadota bacterium]